MGQDNPLNDAIDILGINSVSRLICDQAAGAVSGMVKAMARSQKLPDAAPSEVVGVTMLGNTTQAVEWMKPELEKRDYEVIIFHSSGFGGAAMEEMIRERRIGCVMDYTTDELTDHLVGEFHDAGPKRLETAGEMGLPKVVVPNCIDFFVTGPRDAIPEKWRDRPAYYHNPSFTLLCTRPEEMLQVAEATALKLNAAKGPVAMAIPTAGLPIPNTPDGPFWDPESDRAFREALKGKLCREIRVAEVDAHINDEAFTTRVLELFFETVGAR